MKKFISALVVLVMVMSALALTACGGGGGSSEDLSDSKYVGTWKASAVNVGEESGDLEGEFLMVINGDGTGTLTGGEDGDSSFTWSLIDGGFKTKGDVKMTLKDDGENIKTSMFGIDLVFVKQ